MTETTESTESIETVIDVSFGIEGLREIQLSKRDVLGDLAAARAQSRSEMFPPLSL